MRFNLRGFFRIEAPIIIAVWFLINWYVLNILESISSRGPTDRKADKNREKIYYSEFEGLDFKELLAKIKDANGQNLQIRISRENETQKERITLEYTALVFPHVIDTWKPKKIIPSRKYIFVHNQYTEQLSKNTRAFLSLCAQAGKSGRKVVIPFVRQTRFGSFHSWSPLETYYDVKYLRRLLAAAGYASLVDHQEYEKECPRNSPNHASIHFIDNSQQSMDFTKANFRLKEDFYKAIIKNTTKNGWTKCEFLDKAMKRTSGKQFCVNSDIITDWKVLEKDIVKNEKCLNIFVWRGKGGEDYRVKFSEENYQFSSIQVTFALRPGQTVLNEAERFQEALGNKYIAVHIRGEKILRSYSMQHVRLCVDLVLEVLAALKITTGLSHVYVATDMGDYGSGWLASYRRKNNLKENVFKNIHDYIIAKSQGVVYSPPSDVVDRGVISLVDMNLVARAQYLVTAGGWTFQEWITARFLDIHRYDDKRSRSTITVCK